MLNHLRKLIYHIATFIVVAVMCVAMLVVINEMLTPAEASSVEEPAAEEDRLVPGEPVLERLAAPEKTDPLSLTQAERDALRDRDGCVWGIHIDWSERYPEQEPLSAEQSAFDHFAAWVDALKQSTEPYESQVQAAEQFVSDYTTDRAPFYQSMVETASRYDISLGWKLADLNSYNPIIMAEDNYFITCVPRQDAEERAAEIVALDRYCAARGMEHLYVTTPNDACREDTAISGIMDFYNQNADRLQRLLRLADVDTIDLRDALHEAGMDHHASFFHTDHHWLPETGRWAASVIADYLNEHYGFSVDPLYFAPIRWRSEVYEGAFLGSQGKKVTLAQAIPEDFSLLYPYFPTRFHIEIPSLDVDKSGSFGSAFYRMNVVRFQEEYHQSLYSAYFYGDQALTRVHNEMVNDGKRVLVLGHSFDNCVLPFLALGVEYLDSIDLREFNGSLETFLDENHYDVVIEIYTE